MLALRVCFVAFFLWTSVLSYRRPLGDFINHYETLNYDTSHVLEQHHRVRRSNPYSEQLIQLNLKTEQREFKIRLRRDVELFTDDFSSNTPDFDPSKVFTGHVQGEKHSLVHGFISNEGLFEGKIHVGDDEYFVEPATLYFKDAPSDFHSVMYDSRDVHYPHAYGAAGCGVTEKTKKWMDEYKRSAVKREVLDDVHETKNDPFINRYRRAPGDEIDLNKLSCTLKMRADHLFTEKMAGNSPKRALLLMASHVQAINVIYKNTGFADKSRPEGFQFQIQRMSANTSADKDIPNNPYANNSIGVEKLLEFNSEENHDDVCLSYIFTYRDFADGVLGLAWGGEEGGAIGGICEKATTFRDGKRKSLNTGVVTFVNYNKKVVPKVSQITFAHETGHSYGSPHDSTAACAPGGEQGNFIMFAGATSGDQKNNRLFSDCSRAKMKDVMDIKGICTKDSCCFKGPTQAICGNLVVEKGEQCDCGYSSDDSCMQDKCCFGRPRDNSEPQGCKRKPGKNCSPSEGLCCSVDCEPKNMQFLCLKETECAKTSFCDGMNASCPAPVPKENLTECNSGRQVCISGECSGSICLKYDLKECQCTEEEHLCDVCCTEGDQCLPTSKIAYMNNKALKQYPGAPCDDFNGYCSDGFIKCRAVDADGPLSRRDKNKSEAVQGYLDWVVLFFSMFILGSFII